MIHGNRDMLMQHIRDFLNFSNEPMAKSRFNWRHQYDDEADAKVRAQVDVQIGDPGESMTQKQFQDDADLNVMMKRFGVTDGSLTPAALDPSHFGDFTDTIDFRDALDRTREAQERFNALPAAIRDRFANDPVRLFEFVTNEENADEAVRLGLLARLDPPPEAQPPASEKAPESAPKTALPPLADTPQVS